MHEECPNNVKYEKEEGYFYHGWWSCEKEKKRVQIHTIQKILQINMAMKPELFLLGFMNSEIEKKYRKLILYIITAARLLYAEKQKNNEVPSLKDWIIKLMALVEMARLTNLVREKKDWKPFVDFLLKEEQIE